MTISYVDRIGRIPLLLLGSVGMLVSSLLIACTVYLSSPASTLAGLITVLLICCHVGCFAFSWGPIGWCIPAEIMPLALRGRAVSVTTTVNWLGSFAVGEAVPSMLSAMGVGGTFYVIGCGLAVGLLFVLLIGRETKGVSLEQMEHLLRVEGKEAWLRYCRENWNRGLVLLKVRDPPQTG
jgi:SP family galactose:H+ symporter-like MFS transporter